MSAMKVDFWKVADTSSLQFLLTGYSVRHFCIPSASGIVLCNVGEIQVKDKLQTSRNLHSDGAFLSEIWTYITILAKFF